MKRLICFSGAQGTGKTTAAYRLAADIKMRHPKKRVGTIVDVERFCPMAINQGVTEAGQQWIFATQIKVETEMLAQFDIVVSDRSVFDAVAYTHVAGFTPLAVAQQALASLHWKHLNAVSGLIAYRSTRANAHNHADGVRDSDLNFRATVDLAIEQCLWAESPVLRDPGFNEIFHLLKL